MTSYYDYYSDPTVYSTPSAAGDGYATVASGPAFLLGFSVYNNATGTIYAQAFNTMAKPANSTVPLLTVPVPANSANSYDAGIAHWHPCPTGLTIAASTTPMAYTPVASGCMLLTAYYMKRT